MGLYGIMAGFLHKIHKLSVFTRRLKERLSVFMKVEQQKCCFLEQLHLCLKQGAPLGMINSRNS
jgi:hypothetical protein